MPKEKLTNFVVAKKWSMGIKKSVILLEDSENYTKPSDKMLLKRVIYKQNMRPFFYKKGI